ncbi:ABC transporter ATP-binding protein [Defluviitalea raffinosedens]|uniref:ABC transporter ATP-binding protein n=1 Tax=Defluviitalea raffinosedens TaxID=1450156 RepID=UPI00176CE566|nr:ABC transporter ATP-binding protein [Defluviitalea raffinosedens]MBM7684350.1 putative ABC transport system ATP-binding protein [Defluviitalea raffinosedens]HHW67626.1 ABC transporter ATP-binding protein [Candidatus Epulonipiscium sp.]
MDILLKAKNLRKQYQMGEVTVDALKDASFEIYEGEFIVVLGPSGSGKSTMLNLIGGMDTITSGELYYRDQSLHGASEKELTFYRRNTVGFVFQFYNLMPNLTAYENVKLSVEIAKNPLKVEDVLREVGLEDRADHFPSQMSGGQQQRVSLARAIAKNPEILLCDEPTGALDLATGLQVLKLLRKFNKEYKKTVIIITHNGEIAKMADRVFYIKDGKLSRIEKNEKPLPPEEVAW